MKTWIGMALIGIQSSWKWLLALLLVVVLVGAGFIVQGMLREDSEAKAAINVAAQESTKAPQATSIPKAVPTQAPKATAVSRPRENDRAAPTRAPSTPTVAPPSPTPAAPASVDVPIHLTGANNVGSLEFVLVYDPEVLQVSSVAPDVLANAAVIGSNALVPGRVWVGIADARGIDGSGSVATVTFDIVGRQQGRSALTLKEVVAHDATSLLDILSDATAGEYTIDGHNATGPTLVFTR